MLRKVVIGSIFIILSGVQSVYADGARGIVFFSGGQTTAKQDDFTGTAAGFKLGSGYQATDSSSIEIYWTSYGEAEDQVANADFRAEAFSMTLQYAYHYQLFSNFELLAKAGIALWKTHYGFVGFEKEQDDGTDPVITLGTQIGISDDWAIRVEWEYVEFDNTEVSMVSAGLLSYFD